MQFIHYWQWSNNQKINDIVAEILMMYAWYMPEHIEHF